MWHDCVFGKHWFSVCAVSQGVLLWCSDLASDVVQPWFRCMCGLMFYSSDCVNVWGGCMLLNCKVNHGVSDVTLIELRWFMCGVVIQRWYLGGSDLVQIGVEPCVLSPQGVR